VIIRNTAAGTQLLYFTDFHWFPDAPHTDELDERGADQRELSQTGFDANVT